MKTAIKLLVILVILGFSRYAYSVVETWDEKIVVIKMKKCLTENERLTLEIEELKCLVPQGCLPN